MPTLIEGLKIEIGSTELIGHLTGRAAYHRDKAGMYQGQVEVLLKAGERPRAQSADPVQGLEQKAVEHGRKAALFTFMAEHVVLDAVYRLTEHDLAMLEILARW